MTENADWGTPMTEMTEEELEQATAPDVTPEVEDVIDLGLDNLVENVRSLLGESYEVTPDRGFRRV
mgnify:CR=1 FL=1